MDGLKQLVDETANIKNELIDCHTNLKNNLIDKGIDVLNTDKMSDLINKIDKIELGDKVSLISTGNVYFADWKGRITILDTYGEETIYTFSPTISGVVRIRFYSYGKHIAKVYENGTRVILEKEFPGSSSSSFAEISVTKGKEYTIKVCTAPWSSHFELVEYSVVGGISVNGWNIVNVKL